MRRVCGIYTPRPCAASPAPDSTVASVQRMLDRMPSAAAYRQQIYRDNQADLVLGALTSNSEAPLLNGGQATLALDGYLGNALRPIEMFDAPLHEGAHPSTFCRGSYAFAHWDAEGHTLRLACDTLGTRTLYYSWDPLHSRLVFSSHLPSLTAALSAKPDLDPTAVAAYLTLGFVPAPRTMLRHVHKLFPGQMVTLDPQGQLEHRQDAGLPPVRPSKQPVAELAKQLRHATLETLEHHLGPIDRISLFQGGGLDSTVLAGLLAQRFPDRMACYTAGFVGGKTKLSADIEWASQVARRHGLPHSPMFLNTPNGHVDNIMRLWQSSSEPVRSPNLYAKYLLARAARGFSTVCVTGTNSEYVTDWPTPKRRKAWKRQMRKGVAVQDALLEPRFCLFEPHHLDVVLTQGLGQVRDRMKALHEPYCTDLAADRIEDQFYAVSVRFKGPQKSVRLMEELASVAQVDIRHPLYDIEFLRFGNTIPSRYKRETGQWPNRQLWRLAFDDLLAPIREQPKVGFPSYFWNEDRFAALERRTLAAGVVERCGVVQPRLLMRLDAMGSKRRSKLRWALMSLHAWVSAYQET